MSWGSVTGGRQQLSEAIRTSNEDEDHGNQPKGFAGCILIVPMLAWNVVGKCVAQHRFDSKDTWENFDVSALVNCSTRAAIYDNDAADRDLSRRPPFDTISAARGNFFTFVFRKGFERGAVRALLKSAAAIKALKWASALFEFRPFWKAATFSKCLKCFFNKICFVRNVKWNIYF
jgi:hypothetical protein